MICRCDAACWPGGGPTRPLHRGKKQSAPVSEKFVNIPYTSDDNDSGGEFWLALFTVFYFVAKQGACIVFVFVFDFDFADATGAVVELVVVG